MTPIPATVVLAVRSMQDGALRRIVVSDYQHELLPHTFNLAPDEVWLTVPMADWLAGGNCHLSCAATLTKKLSQEPLWRQS